MSVLVLPVPQRVFHEQVKEYVAVSHKETKFKSMWWLKWMALLFFTYLTYPQMLAFSVRNHQLKTCVYCYKWQVFEALQLLWYHFWIRANPFSGFCPFHFYNICNEQELISGCNTGKVSGIHALHILIEKRFSQF